MYRSNRLMHIVCVVLVLLPVIGHAEPLNYVQEKQKEAEAIGDRILQHFHETRDFGTIFNEYFVSAPSMRRVEIELVFGQRFLPEHRNQIDQAAVERGYIALWNFWYILTDYRFTHPNDEDPPAALSAEYESIFSYDPSKINNGQDLDERFTNKLNHMVDQLRKEIPPDAFESETYKQSLARFKEEGETADVAQMRADFGLATYIHVYVVKREFINYFLIEEKGSLKVFTISLRTNKRL